MKIIHKLILPLVFSIVLLSFSRVDDRHIGEWRGIDSTGHEIIIIMDNTNHIILRSFDITIGGPNYTEHGKKAECKYEIDYSENPIRFDIVGYEVGVKKERGRFRGILRFLTDTKIELRLNNISRKRFKEFDPKDIRSSVILDKVVK